MFKLNPNKGRPKPPFLLSVVQLRADRRQPMHGNTVRAATTAGDKTPSFQFLEQADAETVKAPAFPVQTSGLNNFSPVIAFNQYGAALRQSVQRALFHLGNIQWGILRQIEKGSAHNLWGRVLFVPAA